MNIHILSFKTLKTERKNSSRNFRKFRNGLELSGRALSALNSAASGRASGLRSWWSKTNPVPRSRQGRATRKSRSGGLQAWIVSMGPPAIRALYERYAVRPAFREHVMVSYEPLRVEGA